MSTEILDRSKIGLRKVEYTNEMAKRKRTKGQTTKYKVLHGKLKIKQHEPRYKPWVNSPLQIRSDQISKSKSNYHTITSHSGLFILKSGVRVAQVLVFSVTLCR